MNIKPIRNDDDLRAAFTRLEAIFQAPEGSPEADEMEVLVALVEAYENKERKGPGSFNPPLPFKPPRAR